MSVLIISPLSGIFLFEVSFGMFLCATVSLLVVVGGLLSPE